MQSRAGLYSSAGIVCGLSAAARWILVPALLLAVPWAILAHTPWWRLAPVAELWFWVAVLASVIAGIVRGLTGFGSALVLFPVVSMFIGAVAAAPVVQAIDYVGGLLLLPNAFRRCYWPEVGRISLGAAACVFIGVAALVFFSEDVLLAIAAVFILFVARPLWKHWRYQGRPHWAISYGVGAVSGFMGGATTLSGPPVALFWLGGEADATTFRANVIAFFGVTELLTVLAYGAKGLYTGSVIALGLALIGFYLFGQWLGAKVFPHTSEERFRKFALVLIILVAVVSLFKALVNLMGLPGYAI